ncbi:glutaminyl-peptide cyclotransferase [Aquimarina sp. AD10]|uniref:glutaminyl-peptide cyclotransferase n=1 Tax=Aquimarina sp. AD10 TaxID=1714849 RepID=UPI000E4BE979|nr:glutaminyl-peptide cyclotransferase [Aquimarina sp. AD10]AXT59042.1 glutaminyl-peptide cyclotransferase [Aquimarina sp. AD10]RKM93375.1 glutaminyl-peptide cyclotransferase [Aquimarina sp. AD10]
MNIRNSFVVIILSLFFFSCGSNQNKKKKYFSILTENNQVIFKLGETVKASIKNAQNIEIDSVTYLFNDKKVKSKEGFTYTEEIDTEKLGTHILKAHVFYKGKIDTITKKLTFLNNKSPKLYTYKIIAEYPHDPKAFTQGLEFSGDTLYESTGKKGVSSLRKVNYKTGEVLVKKDIDASYFAEGITILNDKIFQLTWQSELGFIYDLSTLKKTGDFAFNKSKEGWGLCNDGNRIYKSDGTKKIWILDAQTLAEKEYIEVTTNKGVKSRFNELEWIEGKIYANTWQKDGIAIINPKNGALEAVIDLSGLRKKVKEHPELDVLNGIAYKPETKQLFVTGKNWDKLFEIEIIK